MPKYIRTSRVLSLRMDASTGRPATLNEAERSVEVVASTEDPVVVFDWETYRPVREVLLMSGCQVPDIGQVPLLDTHSRCRVADVLGSFRNIHVEQGPKGPQLAGKNVFSATEDGEKPFQKVLEGHVTDVSIGYDVIAYMEIKEGQSAEIEGRMFEGPLRVSTQWKIFELSLCPIGADDKAKIRAEMAPNKSATAQQAGKERTMNERLRAKLRELLRALGITDEEPAQDPPKEQEKEKPVEGDPVDGEGIVDQILEVLAENGITIDGAESGEGEPAPGGEEPAAGAKGKRSMTRADVMRALANHATRDPMVQMAERSRITGIREMCTAHGLDAEQENKLIESGVSLTSAKAQVYDMLQQRRGSGPGFHASTGLTEQQKTRAAIQDALLMRAGITIEKPAPGAEELRGFSLREMAREMVLRSGGDMRGDIRAIVGRALTTTDLPVLLIETSRRTLMDAYEAAPETWKDWCATGTAVDFKESKAVGFEGDVEMKKVSEYGEYREGRLAETAETYKIETFGRILIISRQSIINDDLGALTETPRLYGEACGRLCGDVAYNALLGSVKMGDKLPLFHTQHNNLFAGKGGIPTVEKLGAVVTAMKSQKDRFKKPVTVLPKFFLSGVNMEVACDQFFNTSLQGAGIVGTQAQPLVNNPYGGNYFKRVYDRRFDDLAPNSWVLAAARGTVTVFFLGGEQSPYIETNDNFNTDGFESKVRMDIGGKAMRWVNVAKATA